MEEIRPHSISKKKKTFYKLDRGLFTLLGFPSQALPVSGFEPASLGNPNRRLETQKQLKRHLKPTQ